MAPFLEHTLSVTEQPAQLEPCLDQLMGTAWFWDLLAGAVAKACWLSVWHKVTTLHLPTCVGVQFMPVLIRGRLLLGFGSAQGVNTGMHAVAACSCGVLLCFGLCWLCAGLVTL